MSRQARVVALVIGLSTACGSSSPGNSGGGGTSPGTTVTVPGVVGLTQAAATTALTSAGLALGTVTTAASGTVASGSVISQDPAAGASVAAGSQVNLVVSTGPGGGGGTDESGPPPSASTPVGASLGTPVTAIIGASGGTITSDDGRLTVTVLPGTVSTATTFSVETVENLMASGIGDAYRVGPAGTTFNPPLEVAFDLVPSEMEDVADEDWLVALQPAAGQWLAAELLAPPVPLDAPPEAAGARVPRAAGPRGARIQGRIPQAGTVAPATRYVLSPRDMVVTARGWFVHWVFTVSPAVTGAKGDFLPITLGSDTVSDWAVNGIPGGSAVLGTSTADGPHQAQFQAPQVAPTPATVKVTATVTHGTRRVPLSAKVTITDGDGFLVVNGLGVSRSANEFAEGGVTFTHTRDFRLELSDYVFEFGAPTYYPLGVATYPTSPTSPDYRVRGDYLEAFESGPSGACEFADYSWTALADRPAPVAGTASSWLLGLAPDTPADPLRVRFPFKFVMTANGTLTWFSTLATDPGVPQCSGPRSVAYQTSPKVQFEILSQVIGDDGVYFLAEKDPTGKFVVGRGHHSFDQWVPAMTAGIPGRDNVRVKLRLRFRWRLAYTPP